MEAVQTNVKTWVFYNDKSSGTSIEGLKNKPGQISGDDMMLGIYNGIADLDNRAAGAEYLDLKKFVQQYGYKMSPEAWRVYNVYERYVHNAQAQGRPGIMVPEISRMLGEMRLVKNPPMIPVNASYLRLLNGGQPYQGPVSAGAIPSAPVAAGQQAKVWGDPHVTEADGGKFDFQGAVGKSYNLINDTGLILNATFQSYQGRQDMTTMGEIGGMVSGPNGTSMIRINAHNQPPASVNGISVQPGGTVQLADGGSLSVSRDGKTITIATKEGYQNTITVQGSGGDAYLDYSLRSGAQGVGSDGRMPGGLVGHTFDADTLARNGKTGSGAQGEGAIDGVYTDYEVPGGVLGLPQPQVLKNGAFPDLQITDPRYQQYFGIPTGTSASLIGPDQIQEMWNQVVNDSLNQSMIQGSRNTANESAQKTKKMELLLQLALNSGNIDMAMLLISGLETRRANELAGTIMGRIQELQKERQAFVTDMSKKNQDPQEAARLNNMAGDKSTEISLLQTLLQDLMAQKNEAQQMASNYLKSKHETAQAILRNIG